MAGRGLYIHVPFCKSKCPYCDFYSRVGQNDQMISYTQAVVRVLREIPCLQADTLYFGGGTPVCLPLPLLAEILQAAQRHLLPGPTEITVEANPAILDRAGYRALHEMGVNRLSFGVQSLNPVELRALGRLHTAKEAQEAVWLAAEEGFVNLSCDLMLAIPYQTADSLSKTLHAITRWPITHLSCYLLKIEENTLFARRGVAKLCPDADDTADLYEQTVQTLEQAGFDQYEISNFARRGYESRHNRKYWRCEEYLGIGPGAHSYLEGRRFSCPADLASFLSSPLSRKDEGPGGGLAEETMLRLRLKEGISKEDFAARFDKTAVEELFQRAQRFQKLGLMQRHKDRLFFTTQGFLVSNSVLASLL